MNKRGMILIVAYMVIAVLTIFATAFFVRSVSESKIAKKTYEDTQAFWLADAGINRALIELRTSYISSGTNLNNTSVGPGRYYWNVTSSSTTNRTVTAHGIVPASGTARSERIVEALVYKASSTPSNFYSNAIYCAGSVQLGGNSYSVTGNVVYADELDNEHNHTTGNLTQDESISPLLRLDFSNLYNISVSQGNYYNTSRLKRVEENKESFPTSFWYNQTAGIPNVVYCGNDLKVAGKSTTVGGFYVVAGNVISTNTSDDDATVSGTGKVEGCIYTLDAFHINGGAGGLNVHGGVWAGNEAEIQGNSNITYNATYMSAISNLSGSNASTAAIVSWRDRQNPYN